MEGSDQPVRRQSVDFVTQRVREQLDCPVSRSTIWRWLDEAAIKPWRYRHWIFPRDDQFAEKAGPILDLYAGRWKRQPLGENEFVLSADEKTSLQARRRTHPGRPDRDTRPTSNTNTRGRGHCNIWPPGMCTAAGCTAAANCTAASTRSCGWSSR